MSRFAAALSRDGTTEHCQLRSTFGFLAFHGGALEATTDVIASSAAQLAGASYYGIVHPGDQPHFPSIEVDPQHSALLAGFLGHVEVVVAIHGFGRQGYFTSLLLGGRNRPLAEHIAGHLRTALPAYDAITELERIPRGLRGLHERNPVNLPPCAGVQIELPPRVRGSSPLWWDWEGPGPTPHTARLIEALAAASISWPL